MDKSSLEINIKESEARGMWLHLKTARISDFKTDGAAVGFFKLFQTLDNQFKEAENVEET